MCQFTRIVWHSCGHDRLSTTPEHTLLCTTGTFRLRQGISSAPASCHPLPDDLVNVRMGYDSSKIVQTTHLFDFCDDCKDAVDLDTGNQIVGTPIISPVEARGDYDDAVAGEMAGLRDLHLSISRQCDTTIQSFHAALAARPENRAAIANLRNHWIRDMLLPLLTPPTAPPHNTHPHHPLRHRSLHEVAQLLHTLDTCMAQRVPAPLFSELYALARNKLYQTNARREILAQLTANLLLFASDPTAYEAPLELHAAQLAARLGHVTLPDEDAYAHLRSESPLHAQHAVAVKERVRRGEVERGLTVRGAAYRARSSFGRGKDGVQLVVDTERARKPPQGTLDVGPLRERGELEVVYETGLEGREVLCPLGVARTNKGD